MVERRRAQPNEADGGQPSLVSARLPYHVPSPGPSALGPVGVHKIPGVACGGISGPGGSSTSQTRIWSIGSFSALAGDPEGDQLRDQLASDLLASMNADYSFGLFDVPLSTAFAILSLAAVGRTDQVVRMAQLRLLEFM